LRDVEQPIVCPALPRAERVGQGRGKQREYLAPTEEDENYGDLYSTPGGAFALAGGRYFGQGWVKHHLPFEDHGSFHSH
jgi:hypothetical protein